MDALLHRMLADGVRFSHQAVGRLTAFAFSRGEPAAAYALFQVRPGWCVLVLVCGFVVVWLVWSRLKV